MKKIFILSIFLSLVLNAFSQATFQTRATGIWAVASTWTVTSGTDADNIPDADDDVVILNTHTVTIGNGNNIFGSLTINNGGVLKCSTGKSLKAKGNITNNGKMIGTSYNLFIQANCLFTSSTTYTCGGNIWIQTASTFSIASGTSINAKLIIRAQTANTKVVNSGSVTLLNSGSIPGTVYFQSTGNKWTNNSGSSLTMNGTFRVLGTGTPTIDCSASNNTLTIAGTSSVIPSSANTPAFWDLRVSSSNIKTLSSDLTVKNNLTLTSATNTVDVNGFTVYVGGNFSNSAGLVDFETSQGKIVFNNTSSATQTVSGTTNTRFYDVEIDNPGGSVSFTSTQSVINNLIMTNGNCNANTNRLVLLSDANATAAIPGIADPSAVSFSGSMVIQKFIDERPASYFDLSSPVSNTTVNDWDNEIFISGIGPYDGVGGPPGVDGYAGDSSIFTMHTYNEVTNHFDSVTGSNTSLVVAKGYQLYFADDAGETTWYAKTIDSRGTPNFGDITLTGLTRTAGKGLGWHLVGNPYACAIDYDNTTKTRMTNNVYYTDGGNYTDYFTTFGHRILYPHQGFYVETQNTALLKELKFTEACKVDDHTTMFVRKKPVYDIKLTISSSIMPFSHENNIIFNNNATIGFDEGIDASYRKFPVAIAPAIYMKDNTLNHDMITNYLNTQLEEVTIPLAIFTPKAGMYYIDANVLNTADYNYVWIENTKTGDKFDLNNSVPIDAKAMHTNSDYVLRLSKTKKVQTIAEKAINTDLLIYTTENTLNLKSSTDKYLVTEVLIFDMAGKLLLTKNDMELQMSQAEKIDLTPLPSGIYVVRAMNEKGEILTKKIVK